MEKRRNSLNLAITFPVVAIIAGLLGFGGIAGVAVEFAKIVFVTFLILLAVSLLFGTRRPTIRMICVPGA